VQNYNHQLLQRLQSACSILRCSIVKWEPQGYKPARSPRLLRKLHCVSAVSNKCAVSRAILLLRPTVRKHQERIRPYLGAVYPPGGSALGVNSARTCLFVSSLEAGYKHPFGALLPTQLIPSHGYQSSPDSMIPILPYRGMTGAADI
jgi:hypothetical protein